MRRAGGEREPLAGTDGGERAVGEVAVVVDDQGVVGGDAVVRRVDGDDRVLEQIVKQLNKLVDVIEVLDLTREDFVERELVMIKVSATSGQRSEIIEMANIFRSKVVDMSPASITIEATGSEGKLRALLDLVRPFGIVELVRSGRIAIARSSKNEVSKA